ncbi:hypothetical protein KEM52_000175 [Ascosphaera acerosa]|nr:hypothetical protein KEM52_000175 [Ascosphaera acerosa]
MRVASPDDGAVVRFISTFGSSLLRDKAHKQTAVVKAFVPDSDLARAPLLVLKTITARQGGAGAGADSAGATSGASMSMSGAELRQKMHTSEQLLKQLKALRSPYLVDFVGLMIHADAKVNRVYALFEHANGGSLLDLLRMVGNVSSQIARPWMIHLAEAVDYFHNNGLVHGFIDKSKVLLFRSAAGATEVKLLADIESQLPLLPKRRRAHDPKKYPPRWTAPELLCDARAAVLTPKTDLWDLGVVFAELAFGPDLRANFTSLDHLHAERRLSRQFRELTHSLLRADPKLRPKAFDIPTFEFFRLNAPFTSLAPAAGAGAGDDLQAADSSIPPSPAVMRPRSGSTARDLVSQSRYASDFQEEYPIGRGGFGQVVRARNKFDNRVYAIKKISSRSESSLQQALSETILLSRLNHPYVVRYHAAWVEDTYGNTDDAIDSEAESETEQTYTLTTRSMGGQIHQSSTTGGYDYIRRKGFPRYERGEEAASASSVDVVFEEDSPAASSSSGAGEVEVVFERSTPSSPAESASTPEDSDDSDSEDDDETDSEEEDDSGEDSDEESTASDTNTATHRNPRAGSAPAQIKTLYIQMEYCKKQTLRGLMIDEGPLEKDLLWKLFRQICDGLRDIHSHNIIHRDLKPDNIFIDDALDPRIGDFGLATSGQAQADIVAPSGQENAPEFTRDVGTYYYVAPETNTSSQYTTKVDMYSLGVIFFEMCYHLYTGMERAHWLEEIRKENHVLPEVFETPQKRPQGEIILDLISHNPDRRPSANDLLQSGRIPFHLGEEELRKSVLKILDSPETAEYQKILNTIFSHASRSKGLEGLDLTWDSADSHRWRSQSEMLVHSHVPDRLSAIFRRHGALQSSRKMLFPSWDGYTDGAVRLLGPSGNLLQLRYDLTFPHARAIAKKIAATNKPGTLVEKTFAFGHVYRRKAVHGEPEQLKEVDFDIVTADYVDFPLKAAEVIKVLDEIIEEFPPLRSTHMCFHLGHADILEAVMDFCKIEHQLRAAVKDVISHLHAKRSPDQIRADLLELGVASTSITDLLRFDFRGTAAKAKKKLFAIFGPQARRTLSPIFEGLQAILDYCEILGVKRRIFIRPLASQNARLFKGSMLFQCVFDLKDWDVFAAGGRYDGLIRDLAGSRGSDTYVAVGFNLSCTRLCRIMTGYLQLDKKPKLSMSDMSGVWRQRRCDVLVASFDDSIRLSDGAAIVAHLWAAGISAELAGEANSLNELTKTYDEADHRCMVIVKHESLKVVTMPEKDDFEMSKSKADLVERLRLILHQRHGGHDGASKSQDAPSQSQETPKERASQVLWIGGNAKSRRGIKRADAEDQGMTNLCRLLAGLLVQLITADKYRFTAYHMSERFLDGALQAPITIVDVGPTTLEAVRSTRLSSQESWRSVMHSVQMKDQPGLKKLQECLVDLAAEVDENGEAKHQGAFICSARSSHTIYYDLRG